MNQFEEKKEEYGVLSHTLEHGTYAAQVRWQDGEESTIHFPDRGFEVQTARGLTYLHGREALALLEKHAGHYIRGDFSWSNLLEEKGK